MTKRAPPQPENCRSPRVTSKKRKVFANSPQVEHRSCGLNSKDEDSEIPMKTLEDILARHPFWNDLPPQYLSLLIECASIEKFAPGEQIFKKGYHADRFYLIQHGKIALETEDIPGEGLITIRTLDAGDALGWSGLFPPHQC